MSEPTIWHKSNKRVLDQVTMCGDQVLKDGHHRIETDRLVTCPDCLGCMVEAGVELTDPQLALLKAYEISTRVSLPRRKAVWVGDFVVLPPLDFCAVVVEVKEAKFRTYSPGLDGEVVANPLSGDVAILKVVGCWPIGSVPAWELPAERRVLPASDLVEGTVFKCFTGHLLGRGDASTPLQKIGRAHQADELPKPTQYVGVQIGGDVEVDMEQMKKALEAGLPSTSSFFHGLREENLAKLRDKFAMAALNGLVSACAATSLLPALAAKDAYKYADAMLKARESVKE